MDNEKSDLKPPAFGAFALEAGLFYLWLLFVATSGPARGRPRPDWPTPRESFLLPTRRSAECHVLQPGGPPFEARRAVMRGASGRAVALCRHFRPHVAAFSGAFSFALGPPTEMIWAPHTKKTAYKKPHTSNTPRKEAIPPGESHRIQKIFGHRLQKIPITKIRLPIPHLASELPPPVIAPITEKN